MNVDKLSSNTEENYLMQTKRQGIMIKAEDSQLRGFGFNSKYHLLYENKVR